MNSIYHSTNYVGALGYNEVFGDLDNISFNSSNFTKITSNSIVNELKEVVYFQAEKTTILLDDVYALFFYKKIHRTEPNF